MSPGPAQSSEASGSGAMFDRIAGRYDLLNRLLSLGIDRRWRRRLVDAVGLSPGETLLDLATGTADVAILAARRLPGVKVIGIDPSAGMLEVGRRKVAAAGLGSRVELVPGDAQRLPLPDRSVAAATMAFGIRNVPDRPLALRELARVVRPGGKVAILELSEPRGGLVGAVARLHVHGLVPRLGAALSGASEYRYLHRSIAAFPPPEEFSALLAEAGLRPLQASSLTFGVCHLFVAEAAGR